MHPRVDPGRASERTALGWTRSALNLTANGILVARAAFSSGIPALGFVLSAAIGPLMFLLWRHGQRLASVRWPQTGEAHQQATPLRALTRLTVSVALLAILTVMT
jgi:uncharacterized membrane protein YidH (DUF202 family)